MFSNFYSKQFSPASIVLSWILGFMLGMTVWAFDKNFNQGWIMLIPVGLLAWLLIWFVSGEEKEWHKQLQEEKKNDKKI